MSMEYIVPSLRIVAITKLKYVDAIEEILLQLVQLEEKFFVARFHIHVENQRKKVWHDRHIKRKHFEVKGLVLIYGRKNFKH